MKLLGMLISYSDRIYCHSWCDTNWWMARSHSVLDEKP